MWWEGSVKRKGTSSVNVPKHRELTGQVQHRGAPTSWELTHTGQNPCYKVWQVLEGQN